MTHRYLALLILPLLFVAVPVQAAEPLSISVSKISIIKKPPTCEVRATKKRMTSGSSVDIVWKSENATSMTGLTRDERTWPTKGREHFMIGFTGKHEFPLTFEGPGGKTTCVAKVFVKAKKD